MDELIQRKVRYDLIKEESWLGKKTNPQKQLKKRKSLQQRLLPYLRPILIVAYPELNGKPCANDVLRYIDLVNSIRKFHGVSPISLKSLAKQYNC